MSETAWIRNGHGGTPPDPALFWAKVRKGDGCWEWTGRRDRQGYGRFDVRSPGAERPRPQLAHRVAWVLTYGPIPDGMCACHRCDNPPCCRPDHLFLGTMNDNINDMHAKGRASSGKGEGHARARLNEAAVLAIRAAYSHRTGSARAAQRARAESTRCRRAPRLAVAERFPHPDGLEAAKACALPGCCVFCEEPVDESRVQCGSSDCQRAYYRAWHRDAQVRHPERYAHSPKYLALHAAWKEAIRARAA